MSFRKSAKVKINSENKNLRKAAAKPQLFNYFFFSFLIEIFFASALLAFLKTTFKTPLS